MRPSTYTNVIMRTEVRRHGQSIHAKATARDRKPDRNFTLAALGIALFTSGATAPVVDQREAFARAVLASTAAEWSLAFSQRNRVYVSPRAIFLTPPRRHPSRGFGHARGIGLIIDLGDMADIAILFRSDGDALNALAIAHEVAHQVQHLNERRHGQPEISGPTRELEADCAAGWWLGRANARNLAANGEALFIMPDLDRQIPILFQSLYTLHNGRLASSEAEYAAGHGFGRERADAFRRGLSSTMVSTCGRGVAP